MSEVKEWKAPDLKVTIVDHPPFLDVIAEHKQHKVKLLLKYGDRYTHFEDILGNNYESGIQGKGFGTLLVNVAIQALREKLPTDAEVTGQMSDVGDPQEPTLLEICRSRRAKFWESFGFRILPGEWGFQKIRAKLSDLKEKRDGLVMGNHPRFLPLTEFRGAETMA